MNSNLGALHRHQSIFNVHCLQIGHHLEFPDSLMGRMARVVRPIRKNVGRLKFCYFN